MEVLLPLGIIALLIVLNGLFVAAEFALVMAPRVTIERLAAQGYRSGKILQKILADPRVQDRYIATAQLGITLASLGLGMYGEHALAEWIAAGLAAVGLPSWFGAHAIASVVSVALLTYLHIVLGEMVPKSLALQNPKSAALFLVRPLQITQLVTYPLVLALNGLGNLILAMLRVERRARGHDQSYTAEELQYVVRESQQGGLLRAEAGRVLNDLLDFGQITAGETMVPRTKIAGIPLGASPEKIRKVIERTRHSRYPVYETDLDHIAGFVHLKDLFRLLLGNQSLSASVVREVPWVPQSTTLDRVMEIMRSAQVQMVVIMDEHGGTAGILTMEDLFDEIVGDIEHHPDETEVQTLGSKENESLRAAGTARLIEIGELLDVDLENEEVDTVSGLVLMLLGRPAKVGDVVEHDGLRFEVTEVAGHGVDECHISRLPPDP